ncbi:MULTISPECIES: NAD(P)-dependent oxidoreductase [unclassified Arthrobacter]|uniref:NAD(P)-dependent oxidoreductase n=1 Tax=unclassified Arthrobacter TaxID=235627 RepID=UPI0014916B78|nr:MULTISPECIES: NAD(P)-dependent oxidoreductase [unclassified Arthrobacter]MBE0010036.1 NAD(P)-dependent oxidoreductase [Arthrobacter sp. AET 35A]NOJ63915.1 NAD(P)-dependent oxidoreductase [Arthrobacter sp. 147(2020)]
MHCAIIGLGEAGSRYATALAAAGHTVTAYDPRNVPTPAGVDLATSESAAVSPADLVLVLTSAAVARKVAEACAPHLKCGSIYADMTSSAPAEMESLAKDIEAAGSRFADVAILGPVTIAGAATPLMISGPGALESAEVFRALGATVDTLDAPAGAAMAHKLLRSVFMKGLACLVVEAVAAGEAAGATDWIRNEVAKQLANDGQTVIDRLLTGTRLHAERRGFEMISARDYLSSLDVGTEMTTATVASLERLAREGAPDTASPGNTDDEPTLAQNTAKA